MKKYIYLMTIAICASITGCYDGYMVDSGAMVSKMTTLSPEFEDNMIVLRGEAEEFSEYLYFEMSRNEDFSDSHFIEARSSYDEKLNRASINKWAYIGTWYYKLIAKRGSDVYDVSNVETFTVENPLQMLEPVDVTWKQATLRAETSVNPMESGAARKSYFYVTGGNYYDKTFDAVSYKDVDGKWVYQTTITGLDHSTDYNVIFVQNFFGHTVTSEPLRFTTTPRTTAQLAINYINGEQPDEYGVNHRITDDLSILVYDYHDGGYVTKEPLRAVYDSSSNAYKWAEGNGYTLVDGHSYGVSIFKAAGTKWNTQGNYGGTISYNESYAYGKDQNPIYYGTCEKLTIDNPSIKANLYVKTAQIRIKYPAIWGETTFTLIDDAKWLPSNEYGVEGLEMYGPANSSYEYMGLGNVKSSSETLNEYVINMWPGSYISNKIRLRISNGKNEVEIPCPVNLTTYAGKQYTFQFEGLSINEVYVNKWTVQENGDIIVIKSQK